ncbi:MAG: gamma-glutamyl-gamma-aminobutyrate hydrolase family protein [Verrucomicrobiales bacterium]|nr:gamma-glutamyl-gamma-aminobutyrate hydrolase family protein [Verrucomicrobiales bacterium]
MSEAKIYRRVAVIGLAVLGLIFLRPVFDDRPLIGISGTSVVSYAEAINAAGGRVVMLSYDRNQIPDHLAKLDGLVLPGGADLPPSMYGDEEVHPTVKLVSDERLAFEYELTKRWIKETEKPLLGVCLGCQLLNVVQGGSLIQDIPSEVGSNHREGHPVTFEENAKLAAIFEKREAEVNSSHHQAVKEVGEGLAIAARAPDGVVEAIELMSDRFVVGVQWHPERMSEDIDQKKLFSSFIEAASQKTPVAK